MLSRNLRKKMLIGKTRTKEDLVKFEEGESNRLEDEKELILKRRLKFEEENKKNLDEEEWNENGKIKLSETEDTITYQYMNGIVASIPKPLKDKLDDVLVHLTRQNQLIEMFIRNQVFIFQQSEKQLNELKTVLTMLPLNLKK